MFETIHVEIDKIMLVEDTHSFGVIVFVVLIFICFAVCGLISCIPDTLMFPFALFLSEFSSVHGLFFRLFLKDTLMQIHASVSVSPDTPVTSLEITDEQPPV